jgi:hypothetical protein
MLAFDIMAKVIADDKKRKQNMGTLGDMPTAPVPGTPAPTYGSSMTKNFIPTTLGTALSIGADYAVGQYVYKDRLQTTSEQIGIESSWSESILSTIGGELLGSIVSGVLLPSSLKDFQVTSPSLDSGLAQFVKGAHSLACAYHGYKRHNNSILWSLGWGVFGNAGLAISQHFAKPLASGNPMGMTYVRDIDHSLGSDAIDNPRKRRKTSSSKAKKKSSKKAKRVSRSNPKRAKATHKKATSRKVASRKVASRKVASRKVSARRTHR